MVVVIVDSSDEDDVIQKAGRMDVLKQEYRNGKAFLTFDEHQDDIDRLLYALDSSNIDYEVK